MISGTIRTSAFPATGDTIPLCSALSILTALSSASGPSTIQPLICFLSDILAIIAASIDDCILRETVSAADNIATLGTSISRAFATFTALFIIFTFSVQSGSIFIATSDRKKSLS